MPRGDKICVGWKGQDQEQSYTDVFKRSGISVVDFHQAIKIAYGALTNKRPDGFDFIPFMANNKILGGCEAITNAGPSQGSKFTEFQLFQNGFEFTILFHPLTDKLPTIAPDKIGVDWDKVRSGFRAALRTLYKDRDFEFGAVNVLTGEDGGWEYRLSYHKI
jgi:hypothetical protein